MTIRPEKILVFATCVEGLDGLMAMLKAKEEKEHEYYNILAAGFDPIKTQYFAIIESRLVFVDRPKP